jgi:hypothetical protein
MAASLVRLPFYTELSQSDQDRVIDVVRSFEVRTNLKSASPGLSQKRDLV